MPGTKVFACEFIIHEFSGEPLVRGLDEKTKLPLWVENKRLMHNLNIL